MLPLLPASPSVSTSSKQFGIGPPLELELPVPLLEVVPEEELLEELGGQSFGSG
ncbi:hypothetical protein JNK13_10725 [bacterium]|nr:hypothetical protein [bacterium]